MPYLIIYTFNEYYCFTEILYRLQNTKILTLRFIRIIPGTLGQLLQTLYLLAAKASRRLTYCLLFKIHQLIYLVAGMYTVCR